MKNNTILIRGLIIFCILSVFVYFYYLSTYDRKVLVNQIAEMEVESSEDIFNLIKDRDIDALSTIIDTVSFDKGFKDVFLKKDRVALFNYSLPLFNSIKNDYEITHFYFHLPDGTNFVRIHDKVKFDDKINRLTFKQAVDSKVVGSGIELGKTAFALRVVKPYYDNNELIGYLELGQEMDHFLRILKEKTNAEYSIFVKKDVVDKDNWLSVRLASGLSGDWDNFKNLVEMSNTISGASNSDIIASCLNENNAQKVFDSGNSGKFVVGEVSASRSCAGFYLLDALNNKIGVVLLSSDISVDLATINKFVLNQIIFILALLIFVFSLLYYVSRKNLQAQKKYKTLFEGSEDAILTLVPPDWNFFDGNGSAIRLFGMKNIDELRNTPPSQVSPEKQADGTLSVVKAKEMVDIALSRGSYSFEWIHKKITGEEFNASVLLTKIDFNKNIVLQAVVRDITKDKKSAEIVEKSIQESKRSLDQAEKANKLMVGRELEMIKLKKEIVELKNNNNIK